MAYMFQSLEMDILFFSYGSQKEFQKQYFKLKKMYFILNLQRESVCLYVSACARVFGLHPILYPLRRDRT